MMKVSKLQLLLAALVLIAVALDGFAADPLVYLSFDDTWDNSGTAGPEIPSYIGSVNGRGPIFDSGGVKGSCLTFDIDSADPNTGSLVYGTEGATDSAMEVALQDLRSFTVMGWLNSDSEMMDGRIFSRPSVDENDYGEFTVYPTSYKLRVLMNDDNNDQGSGDITIRGRWVFFAVTYNVDLPFLAVTWYAGNGRDVDDLTISAYTDLLTPGEIVGTHHSPIIIGGGAIDEIPFDGKIDEFRIFGSKTDGSGALSMDDIKAFYAEGFLPKCGDQDHPYPEEDINTDCVVDISDLELFMAAWLTDVQP